MNQLTLTVRHSSVAAHSTNSATEAPGAQAPVQLELFDESELRHLHKQLDLPFDAAAEAPRPPG